jgi:hypothetical protein
MVVTHRFFTLLFLLLLPLALHAQPARTFAAQFVQTRTLPGFDQPIVSHGELHYSAADGFRWEVSKPYHYLFQMRDDVAHEQLPDGTQRELRPDQTPWLKIVQQVFVHALAGDRERLRQYFDVQITPTRDGRNVVLIPHAQAMAKVIRRIAVTETRDGHPQQLDIDEAGGGHMDIRFTPLAGTPGGVP